MTPRRATFHRLGAALLAALGLAAAPACAGLEGTGERSDGSRAERPPATAPKPAPERPLPAAWYEDPDGDLIPTAIEQRIGRNPQADDCAMTVGCPGVDSASGLPDPERPQNTLLMLDSSGSMAGPAGGGKTKIEASKDALRRYVVGTPDSFNLGFLVYGHKGSDRGEDKAESCRGSELLSPLGELDSRSVPKTLARFEPRGYTPVAGALKEARRAFEGKREAYNRIILVSDGVETCGGDPVAAARALKEAGIKVTVDVVGFDIGKQADRERLRRIAEVTGGEYSDARTGADLDEYFDRQSDRISALLDQNSCLLGAQNDLYSCQLEASNDASSALTPSRYVYPDDVRAEEVERIREEMRDQLEVRRETARDRSDSVRDRLRKEQDEASRRLKRERQQLGSATVPSPRLYARSPCPRLLPPRAAALVASGPAQTDARV